MRVGSAEADACMRRLWAECEANDRLRAEDPAAFEAKMRAELPTSKCTLSLRRELQGIRTQRAPRARRGRGVRRVQRGDRGAAALPQVVTVSAGDPLRAGSGVHGRGPRARVSRLGSPSRWIMTAGAGDV